MAPNEAIWVGELDRLAPRRDLQVDPGFRAARLLATAAGTPQGLLTVPLHGGRATVAELEAACASLGPATAAEPPPVSDEPVTVVIATRNRSESLARCLRSVLAGDHPDVRVVVVDNDPDDESSARVVRAADDPRVRYVREPRRGTSVGRNRGLAEARTEIVAFTDDDTEVDRAWARRVAGAFATDPELACLSGPVHSARLDTTEERAADAAMPFNGFTPRRFSLAEPPPESAVFPFAPGLLGIGANMAVRASRARAVGAFDEALGPGTPTKGGEDCEFMVRLVLTGMTIGYVPGAWVWHHHRSSPEALRAQLDGYSIGLGSFLTKVALSPRGLAAALRRLPAAVARLRSISDRETNAVDRVGVPNADGGQPARRGLLSGATAYLRSRRDVRRAGGAVPDLVPSDVSPASPVLPETEPEPPRALAG